MTKYHEIIRLHSLDFSARAIARSCNVSRNSVSKVLAKAKELNISWPLPDEHLTDADLERMLFPKPDKVTSSEQKMPDFSYIRKELLRNGVSKKLLWVEYCEECRMNNEEPLMYSRFCYYVYSSQIA